MGLYQVNRAVPQESVLGQLLFLITANNLADGRVALLFADDMSL